MLIEVQTKVIPKRFSDLDIGDMFIVDAHMSIFYTKCSENTANYFCKVGDQYALAEDYVYKSPMIEVIPIRITQAEIKFESI